MNRQMVTQTDIHREQDKDRHGYTEKKMVGQTDRQMNKETIHQN